ncbi:hypothetical protein BC831DRAFT_452607, partial [Entophlyctis helioformis]
MCIYGTAMQACCRGHGTMTTFSSTGCPDGCRRAVSACTRLAALNGLRQTCALRLHCIYTVRDGICMHAWLAGRPAGELCGIAAAGM